MEDLRGLAARKTASIGGTILTSMSQPTEPRELTSQELAMICPELEDREVMALRLHEDCP